MGMKDRMEEFDERVKATARAKWLTRWMEHTAEVSGKPCEDPDGIDYTLPHIHIEWLLCDPVNMARIKSRDPEVRARFFDQLTEEEKVIYYQKDANGQSYSDMENINWKDEVKRGVKKIKSR